MTDLEDDLHFLASRSGRWSLSHPIRYVKDWSIVVWRDVPVRRSEHGEVIEAESFVKVLQKAADWFRENG